MVVSGSMGFRCSWGESPVNLKGGVKVEVTKTLDWKHGAKIQIAQVSKGGNSSYAKKDGYKADSIRLCWYAENGKFDPISSSEVPIDALKDMLLECFKRDMYDKIDLSEIIGMATASVYRQLSPDSSSA